MDAVAPVVVLATRALRGQRVALHIANPGGGFGDEIFNGSTAREIVEGSAALEQRVPRPITPP